MLPQHQPQPLKGLIIFDKLCPSSPYRGMRLIRFDLSIKTGNPFGVEVGVMPHEANPFGVESRIYARNRRDRPPDPAVKPPSNSPYGELRVAHAAR